MPNHATAVSSLEPVLFRNDTIYAIEYNGEAYTPLRPIVENMGLDWKTQYRKINTCRDRWGVVIMTTPSNGGTQSTLCIPLRKLPGFLATINPNKVKNSLRPKIVAYQNECDEVLWNYWNKKHPAVPAMPPMPDMEALENRLRQTIKQELAAMVPACQTAMLDALQVWYESDERPSELSDLAAAIRIFEATPAKHRKRLVNGMAAVAVCFALPEGQIKQAMRGARYS